MNDIDWQWPDGPYSARKTRPVPSVDDLYPIRPPAAPEAEATWDIVIRDAMARRDDASILRRLTLDRVVAKMRERDRKGLAEYGRRLAPGNGRNSLLDAQEELLDAVAYLECAASLAGGEASENGTVATLREIQAQCLDGAIRLESILGGNAS